MTVRSTPSRNAVRYATEEHDAMSWGVMQVRKTQVALGGFAADCYQADQDGAQRPDFEEDHPYPSDRENVRNRITQLILAATTKNAAVEFADIDEAVDEIHLTDEQRAKAEAIYEELAQQTLALVTANWPAIERVAEALMSRDILTEAEIDALIGAGGTQR
jgi:hypothetical protein